jgi:predicted secreted protein
MTTAPTRRSPHPTDPVATAAAPRGVGATVAIGIALAALAGCESMAPSERPTGLSSPIWGAPSSAGSHVVDGVQAVDLRGFRIASRVGEAFEVRLPGFPSSGYRWTLVDPVPAAVRTVGIGRSDAGPGELSAAPGQEVWRFEGAGTGGGVLNFEFRRSGDPSSAPPAQRASYRVDVR